MASNMWYLLQLEYPERPGHWKDKRSSKNKQALEKIGMEYKQIINPKINYRIVSLTLT